MSGRHLLKKATVIALVFGLTSLCLLWLDRWYPLDLKPKSRSTLVTAKDGTPLRAFADDKGIWRYPIDLTQLSPLYLKALLTYEDRWFYYHPGINPISFFRAAIQNLAAGRIVSGGSTLTMQVARILYPGKKKIAGKCCQILRALQLEAHLTKSEIIGLYVNYAPFGSNIEGVQTAAFAWLGKPVRELSRAEAALLAVLPQAPSFYRPDRHPDRAKKARDKVLDRMETFGIWTGRQVLAAKKEPVAAFRFTPPVVAPLAARHLYAENQGQAIIETTLDFDRQVHVETLVRDYVSGLSEKQSCAVMVVNHKTLDVDVYVGSADFFSKKRNGHVDMIRALRSPGSALKPFLYGLAMDEGLIHSQSMLMDVPRFAQAYAPGNFSKGFAGPVSVTQALRLSLNVPAVQVLEVYGPHKFHDRLINAGARLELIGKPNLSMILGGVGTDLSSLITLYTALARDGIAGQPHLVKGEPIQERYLLSPGAAWIVRQILERPLPGFEGIQMLDRHVSMAWKTGTSYGFRDAWALGIMGDYVAGVWVGRPDGSPSPGQYGAVTAIPLLQRIVQILPMSKTTQKRPDTVQNQIICWPLGIASDKHPGNCFVRHEAWILDHQIPLTLYNGFSRISPLIKTFWVDENGYRSQPACGGREKITLGLWPESAAPWLPRAWQRKQLIPPPSPVCPDIAPVMGTGLKITSVTDNSFLTRLPGDSTSPSISLTVQGGRGKTLWFLDGSPIGSFSPNSTGVMPMPLPGAYQLAVADQDGNSDMVRFEVISVDRGE